MRRENRQSAFGADLSAFAGITTFMHQPVSRELGEIDAVIVGVPFDGGSTSFRSGARFGPRKIREMSSIIWGYNRILEVAPAEALRVADYGDVDVDLTDIKKNVEIVGAEAREILSSGPKIIALGGDHSITYPLLRAHFEKYGPVAVVHFDSHSDTSPEDMDHGTPFRQAIGEGLIDTDAYIQIGIRGSRVDSGCIEFARSLGAKVLTIEDCFSMGLPAIVETIHEMMGKRTVYVSLDIDAIDPAYAPATSTPEVGGFTSYQMLQLIRGLRGLDLVGFDLVEVCPPYDNPGEITSILAANLVFEFLSLLAVEKWAKGRVVVRKTPRLGTARSGKGERHKMKQIPKLETERLMLVEITKEYVDALFEMYSDKEIAFFFCIEPHASPNETLSKIESIENDFRIGKSIEWAIVLKELNTIVGTVGFNTYKNGFKGNIGFGIHRRFWRRGYAHEAIQEIVRFGFEELNLHRIEAEVDPRNHASVALLIKLGFLKEGHIRDNEFFLGEFCSTLVFGKLDTDGHGKP